MIDNNSRTTFIITFGIIILIIFTIVLSINLLPNYESNSYFTKVDNEINAKIESVDLKNNNLLITTSGDPIEYCVKTTRTKPTNESLCWNKIENNTASISILKNKKYYIWIKDKKGNISNYLIVNSNDKENK